MAEYLSEISKSFGNKILDIPWSLNNRGNVLEFCDKSKLVDPKNIGEEAIGWVFSNEKKGFKVNCVGVNYSCCLKHKVRSEGIECLGIGKDTTEKLERFAKCLLKVLASEGKILVTQTENEGLFKFIERFETGMPKKISLGKCLLRVHVQMYMSEDPCSMEPKSKLLNYLTFNS